jgi:putative phosphoesterase
MQIGLISDTHNRIPYGIEDIFEKVDFILHAGDIGQMKILDQLNKIAQTFAVYGNTDSYVLASQLQAKLALEFEGLNFLLIHNINHMNTFLWRLEKGEHKPLPDIVIYGHTHKPTFQKHSEIYFINPGSASMPPHGLSATVMTLDICDGKEIKHHLVELSREWRKGNAKK